MSDVSVPTTPTTPNLREQVANALAGSNLREVGDDGTLVRPFAAKSPMAFAYADAALSVVAPVLEGLRADLDAMSLTARQAFRALERRDKEITNLRADRDKEHESRIAWALEADRLQQIADNAITALEKLRDEQLDRIAPVECDCAEHGVDCHAAGAQFVYMRAIRIVRPSVSDQTPATPDDVPAVRITVGPTPTEPRPFLDAIFGPDRQWHDVPVGEVVCSCHGVNVFEPPAAAPSSVQGDTTPDKETDRG